jgi:hypothetical protein
MPAAKGARQGSCLRQESSAGRIANESVHGLVRQPSARTASGGAHSFEELGNLVLQAIAVARQRLRGREDVG